MLDASDVLEIIIPVQLETFHQRLTVNAFVYKAVVCGIQLPTVCSELSCFCMHRHDKEKYNNELTELTTSATRVYDVLATYLFREVRGLKTGNYTQLWDISKYNGGVILHILTEKSDRLVYPFNTV